MIAPHVRLTATTNLGFIGLGVLALIALLAVAAALAPMVITTLVPTPKLPDLANFPVHRAAESTSPGSNAPVSDGMPTSAGDTVTQANGALSSSNPSEPAFTQPVPNTTSASTQLAAQVDQILAAYLLSGKLQGPQGGKGDTGLAGPQGPAGTSLGVSVVAPDDKLGGLAGSFKYLSGDTVTASSLTASGVSVTGSLSVAGATGLDNLSFSNATSTGTLNIGGDLTVSGATSFAGGVVYTGGSLFNAATTTDSFNIGRTLAIATSTSPDFALQVGGPVMIAGNTALQGTLTGVGEAFLNSGARISSLNATTTNIDNLTVNTTLQGTGVTNAFNTLLNATTTLDLTSLQLSNGAAVSNFYGTGLTNVGGALTVTGMAPAGYQGAWQQVWANTLAPTNTAAGFYAYGSSTVAANFRVDRISGGTEQLFRVGSSTADVLTVLSNGNVGIETTNPATALQVNGTVTATSFTNGANTAVFGGNALTTVGTIPVVTSSGTLGQSISGFTLSTGGSGTNMLVGAGPERGNNTGTGNTSFGPGGVLYSNTSGIRNTAFGNTAMFNNTTGSFNTAIGRYALTSNTTGSSNVAIGETAGTGITTGSFNIAIGQGALLAAAASGYNVAVGQESMNHITTGGGSSVAVGFRALFNATTANYNTAIGNQALFSVTTGDLSSLAGNNNTAVGFDALLSNTTGFENSAVGMNALFQNTTGYNNVAVGSPTMESNTTGYNNVAVGVSALELNTTGYHNTAIGQDAGWNGASDFVSGIGNVSGHDNTYLGYGAGPASTIQHNFSTAVGSGATAECDNCVVLGRATDNVGIGSTAPGATLQVTGTGGTALFASGTTTKVSIANTSPDYTLTVGNSSVSGIVARFQNSVGTCDINPTGSDVHCTSDERLKTNITDMGDMLQKVLALQPVYFNWKTESATSTLHAGLIAQAVEQILPDLVSTDPATGLKSLGYSSFVPYLISAIQQQQKEIQALQNQTGASLSTDKPLTVYAPDNFSGDSVGEAKILSGATSVRVTFTKPYAHTPVITFSTEKFAVPAFIADKDATGFTLAMGMATTTDVMFDWHSFASPEARLFVSDGTTVPLPAVVVTPTPAGDSASTTPATDTPTTTPATSDPVTTPATADALPTPAPETPTTTLPGETPTSTSTENLPATESTTSTAAVEVPTAADGAATPTLPDTSTIPATELIPAQ